MSARIIVLHPDDNVGTAVDDLAVGEVIRTGDLEVQVAEAVPYGHKLALRAIARNETVLKYGESIGIAATEIPSGGYVHVHNVESRRGRGDISGGAKS